MLPLARVGGAYGTCASDVAHDGSCAVSGCVFVLTWPLFPAPSLLTNCVAASVVGAATVQFILVGTGVIKDKRLVNGVGHGPGHERKLLEGPTQYGIVLTAATAAAFRKPLSVVLIGVLCAGDATAALVGRAIGRIPLPWCKNKVCFCSLCCGWCSCRQCCGDFACRMVRCLLQLLQHCTCLLGCAPYELDSAC